MTGIITVAARAVDISQNGAPLRRVKLLPIGSVAMRDGRGPFIVRDQAHAARIVTATQDWLGSADMMFDYDHQSVYAAGEGKGGTAIAAGWAKASSLIAEPDGIHADVQWTAAAAQKIAAREYRYLSPLFMAAQGTGEVLRLKNAALVNMGAIDLPAIAASAVLTHASHRVSLTAEEIDICARYGWDAVEFLAQKTKESQEVAATSMLSAEELAVCRATGTQPADFLQFKEQEVTASIAVDELSAEEIALCRALGWHPAAYVQQKAQDRMSDWVAAGLTAEEVGLCSMRGVGTQAYEDAKKEMYGYFGDPRDGAAEAMALAKRLNVPPETFADISSSASAEVNAARRLAAEEMLSPTDREICRRYGSDPIVMLASRKLGAR